MTCVPLISQIYADSYFCDDLRNQREKLGDLLIMNKFA